MRAKVTMPVAGLERVLEDLAWELIHSTDDELLQAAKDLGMDPTMRGSAAFIGLKYPATPRPSDFFEMPVLRDGRGGTERSPIDTAPPKKRLPGRKKRRKPTPAGSKPDSE